MWMNDYEYDFVKDSADKKNIARSSRSTRTHCGKGGAVKLPSDYLTKKELKAMSGEVIKYASLKKPMSWKEFKELPNDLKKEYLTSIREKFGAPDTYIAQMFGISANCLSLYFKDLGLGAGKGSGNGNRKWKKEEFFAWISGADLNAPIAPVAEPVVEDDTDSSSVSDNANKSEICAVPKSGDMTFNCTAEQALNTLAMILGDKKVEMIVEWRVIDEARVGRPKVEYRKED